MQATEEMEDEEMKTKLLDMLKEKESLTEQERILRVMQMMDPRDAEVVAQNMKTMSAEERVGFLH